jgi:hypothetical protein
MAPGQARERLASVTVDPLSAVCPHCRSEAGFRCLAANGTLARKPHLRRVRLALALAAHADPALDAFFPRLGACGFCGPRFDQRHRVIDGIAGMLAAGEDPEVVAEEFGRTPEAVDVVMAWAKRWPGAWL